MAILNIYTYPTGVVGVNPSIAYIDTNDTIATVLTTGYLNKAVQQGYTFNESMMCCVSTKTTPSATSTQVAWMEISKSGANWSLVPAAGSGSVTLPTIANHIATYTNTTGGLSEDPATAISGGNIQAGLSGTAGYLASFPGTAARGSLRLTAVANTGDTLVTISNAAMGQASVISIPDPGAATANFLLSATAGGQTIAGGLTISTGNLGVTLGNITAAAGNIAATLGSLAAGTTVTGGTGVTATTGNITASAGNVIAGATGAAGTVTSFSGTGSAEFLRLAAIDNAGGNFSTTISNAASVGQSQTISIPDVGAATGNFLLSGLTGAGIQHITSGSLEVDAGSLLSGIGTGGFVGLIKAFPTTATSGFIAMQAAVNATGDFGLTISNSTAQAQATVLTIPDIGAATGFLNPQTVTAASTPASVLITKDITLGFAALAAGGTVDVQAALATSQYKVRNIFVNYGAAGLSGGGGDRLVTLTDGTTVYNNAGITAALLGTPVNTVWGGTGNPLAGTVDQSTATVAGQALRFVYSGGTTDYTAGSVVVTVTYERIV